MFIPKQLYHYFDKGVGPFKNLSLLNMTEAEKILDEIRLKDSFFASKRSKDYLKIRFELEEIARERYIAKGGDPKLIRPYSMTLGACDWIKDWYPDPDYLVIDLALIDPLEISFTYGDLFPAFRFQDGQDHFNRVYCINELPGLIRKFGLPQRINPKGEKGPKRYIEAQIWNKTYIDESVKLYLQEKRIKSAKNIT